MRIEWGLLYNGVRRSSWPVVLAIVLAWCSGPGRAQVVRDNVNIISPEAGSFVGDIFERQVETDIAVSPLNPSRAMAGFITYQTLNMPAASSWCGYSITNNGGKTWKSNLLPGFPQDTSPAGTASPIHDLIQCADPALAAAPPNTIDPAQIYFGGLGMTRGVQTKVFVTTFADPDDGTGALPYLRTVLIDTGNYSFQGQVLDKPAVAVDPPSASYPQGIIHFTYVVFNGTSDTDFRTKVLYARSTDGGRTFSKPVKLNATWNRNNGTAIARSANGTVYVFWRTFLEENGIQVVSIDRAGNISKPVTVAGGAAFYPYDQPSLANAFRSNAFPTGTADANGTLFAAWQEYVDGSGMPSPAPGVGPRIVLTSSTDGGQTWTPRKAVEVGTQNAFQFQPDLSAGGGLISLLFYDARNDGRPLDANGLMTGIDRRMEVRVAQAAMTSGYAFNPSVEVSKYATYSDGMNTGQPIPRPGFTSTTWGACKSANAARPWICDAVNLPNLRTSSGGAVPFIGDYMGLLSAVEFKRENGVWRLALQPGDYEARTFYGVWADTRLASFPGSPLNPNIDGDWGPYMPGSNCANPGSRNTKPFFAVISPGVVARWSGTSRPLYADATKSAAVNAFTIAVENQTGLDKFFRLTILDNAPNENWSFVQPPYNDSNTADLQILRNSTFTRGVYYRGTNPSPALPVIVRVDEITGVGGAVISPPMGLSTSVTVAISGSPIIGSSLYGLGVSTQSVTSLPGAKANKAQPHNFGFENFGFENFGFENFGFENFGFENFGFENSPPDYDVTWTVSGQGLLPTSGNSFVNVADGQNLLSNGYKFRLFAYLTHATPALNFGRLVNGCPAQGQFLQDQAISNIPITGTNPNGQVVGNFGFENFGFENFGFENYPPDIGDAAFVADQDGVKLTLRSYKNYLTTANYAPTPTNGVVSQGVVAQALNPGQTTRTGSFDDTTPPVITPTITGTLGQNGWYRSNVTVTWSVSDPGSGITTKTGCDTVTLTSDTPGTTLTCSAVNGKGMPASNSVTIKIDKTPPTITATVSPAQPAATGWYNQATGAPTVTFTCSDAVSGVVACPAAMNFKDGQYPASSQTVADQAGNTASVTVGPFQVDTTPPTISAAASPAPSPSGWYNISTGAPTASFTCSDATSGLPANACPTPVTLTEGANQSVSRSVTDQAGNTGTATLSGLNVDLTRPTITITAPADKGVYLLNASVAANYACADTLSGVKSCSGPVSSGANISTSSVASNPVSFTVNAADNAGNTAALVVSYSVVYKFILTPPKDGTLGSAIPLVWQLADANKAFISDMSSLLQLISYAPASSGVCGGGTAALLYSPATGATGKSSLQYLTKTNSFQFNWDTSTASATGPGCYVVVWKLKDNSTQQTSVVLK